MADRKWSAQQQAIFTFFATGLGNLCVRARAGTGKTTTILEGINHAPERNILLAAFNKKIAGELTAKLRNPNAQAKTLHSVGFSVVMRNWNGVQLDNDRGERLARASMTANAPNAMVTLVKKLVSLAKGTLPFASVEDLEDLAEEYDVVPEADYRQKGWTVNRLAKCALQAMEKATEKDGTIDFDDMVYLPVRCGWASGKFDLVVVDEAQDMSFTQIRLAQLVCKKGGRIVVVGDDRQAIYGFRGADSDSIDRLKSELEAVELGLTITYRCPKKVVELAAEIVPDYTAAPEAPEGVVRECNEDKMLDEAEAGDFILSRKNAPLARICLSLLKAGKRAKIEGRDLGKGLQALVKQLRAQGIPDLMIHLEAWRSRELARAMTLRSEAQQEHRAASVNDKAELLMALMEGVDTVDALIARITDLFDDTVNPGARIVCSSVHRAKGLEANRVYVLVDTLYPGKRGKADIEEANIEYVAITRAKQTLVLVSDEGEE